MGYFKVRYDSRVVNYDCRGFIRLATEGVLCDWSTNYQFYNTSYTYLNVISLVYSTHRHLINRPSTPLKTLAQQHLLYGRCQWVQIIALNLNFPLKFIRDISSCWIKHEKESKKIGRARSIYSWSRWEPNPGPQLSLWTKVKSRVLGLTPERKWSKL